ncbi:MAG: hypothetical protein ACOCZS_02200 [Verrucomicrobiota bacterium]
MANKPLLTECKACGTKISRHAPFCRNCGHPQGRPLFVWLLAFFLIVLLLLHIAMSIYCFCNLEQYRTSSGVINTETQTKT